MSVYDAEHLDDAEVNDLADGLLDDAARVRAEAHLAACERCRQTFGETRGLLAWTRDARGAVAAPRELWTLVAASTVHRRAVRRQVLRDLRGVALLAALALAAATALVTWRVARWTLPRDAATPAVARPGSLPPGTHAGHPTAAPRAPRAPRAPAPYPAPRP